MARVRSEKDFVALTFPAGMNNIVHEEKLPVDQNGNQIACRDAVNVDFEVDGSFALRDGFVQRQAMSAAQSLFAHDDFPYMLAREGDTLVAFNRALVKTVLATGLGDGAASYVERNGEVLWTVEGRASGRVDASLSASRLGLPSPGGIPAIATAAGYGLRAGTYMVALSYRAADGEEGGTGRAHTIVVGDNGGIAVTLPTVVPAGVTSIRVWCSTADGNVLEHVRDVPAGLPTFTFGDGDRGKDISTQFLGPLPYGQLIATIGAFTFMAVDNRVYYTESFRNLCHLGTGYVEFKDRIDMMLSVGEGEEATLMIASGKRIYRLQGKTPRTMTQRFSDMMAGAVPGTGVAVDASIFGPDFSGQAAYWLGTDGIPRMALPGGRMVKLTEESVVMNRFAEGSTLLRSIEGKHTLVTTGRGGAVSRMKHGDTAEVLQYRNGILID